MYHVSCLCRQTIKNSWQAGAGSEAEAETAAEGEWAPLTFFLFSPALAESRLSPAMVSFFLLPLSFSLISHSCLFPWFPFRGDPSPEKGNVPSPGQICLRFVTCSSILENALANQGNIRWSKIRHHSSRKTTLFKPYSFPFGLPQLWCCVRVCHRVLIRLQIHRLTSPGSVYLIFVASSHTKSEISRQIVAKVNRRHVITVSYWGVSVLSTMNCLFFV
jgi:hypothetical protein